MIFASLSLKDRKNVRLTCRLWYECSVDPSITKNEKLIFGRLDSAKEIACILPKLHISVANLEFRHLMINDLSEDFWNSFGPAVHTLYFNDCYWNANTILNIIVCCDNLKNFRIKRRSSEMSFPSPEMLDDLIAKGIRRPKLHTFTWFINEYYLPESVLQKIFIIFPNIKYFGTGAESYDYNSYRSTYDEYNFDECLTPTMQLDRLVFNMPTEGRWLKKSIMKPKWQSRFVS